MKKDSFLQKAFSKCETAYLEAAEQQYNAKATYEFGGAFGYRLKSDALFVKGTVLELALAFTAAAAELSGTPVHYQSGKPASALKLKR